MLLYLALILSYKCNINEQMKKLNIKQNMQRLALSSRISSKWRPIRITLNYDFLEGKRNYPYTCKNVGQVIEEIGVVCEANDIITEKQISAIKGTLNNVVDFLSHTLKVQSVLDPIKVEIDDENKLEFNNTDLVLIVTSQKIDGALASAGPRMFEDTYRRTIVGIVEFNPSTTPEEAVSENDWNDK
ncbi:hypothetical protein TVAG_020910 [Trichomonas vaginalis G3]|uniref:Uncharacterized protein n=1 Tax=Trichomonas vaginalis (strain ATCC PRA-98 / G3) TaxID=412133 RepID=A2DH73_TRIV3|nr:regulation of choline O-acetyltransferase protein [Trichomonas vaginalis G3]EAY20146.1 hypothetical protein TVAG_020910 [Trichomonas vaginalis G3]KAI5507613.1 regulation of choline O-acetyltransferase protein [Trichomonas vaginalis G3]|eukprot:XP_001581132.1 hypothetical protein [Trichomonas vaginalis G3]